MSTTMLRIKVGISVEKEDDGTYYAYCPALKGIHVPGNTEQEAVKNAVDAVGAYLQSLKKHNDPLPLCIIEKSSFSDMFSHLFSAKPKQHIEEVVLAA